MAYQVGVIGSSDRRQGGRQEARMIGREIAKSDCQLLTGACTGLPESAAEGAKEEGGLTVGISPAVDEEDHIDRFQYPTENYDLIVYTGFGLKGRNPILIRSCQAVIALSGKTGTLNELTIAYGKRKPIGLLRGLPGAADEFEELLERLEVSDRSIVSSADPKELVPAVLEEIEE